MPNIKILTETELRNTLPLDIKIIDCIESAFSELASGKVIMPPILSMPIKEYNGEIDVKTAYLPSIDSFALKASPGFFDNPKIGLPSTSGLMILFSCKTGVLEALLLDNGYLTDIRTAAAGAVAARHLSRIDSSNVCIIGAGTQAKLQLTALNLVRPIQYANIWARNFEKASLVAEELSIKLGFQIQASNNISESIKSADIVVTTTPSTEPILKADWLHPGLHITAMGADQHTKNELDPNCLKLADLYVADSISQTVKQGELRAALDAKIIALDKNFPELGQIINKTEEGRSSPKDITIVDLTGTGAQDTAIATYALKKAVELGVGEIFHN
jgi:ornithine cyclodeaminase